MSETDRQPLKVDGVEFELRYRPPPVFVVIDDFKLFERLEGSGVLDMLTTAGTGVDLNPSHWDMGDAALVMSSVIRVLGHGEGEKRGIVEIMQGVLAKYGVQVKIDDGWEPAESAHGLLKHAPDAIPFVFFECLRGSFAPFISRLLSTAKARAAKSSKLSDASAAAA